MANASQLQSIFHEYGCSTGSNPTVLVVDVQNKVFEVHSVDISLVNNIILLRVRPPHLDVVPAKRGSSDSAVYKKLFGNKK